MSDISHAQFDASHQGWVVRSQLRNLSSVFDSLPTIQEEILTKRKSVIQPEVHVVCHSSWLSRWQKGLLQNIIAQLVEDLDSPSATTRVYLVGGIWLSFDESRWPAYDGDTQLIRYKDHVFSVFPSRTMFKKYMKDSDLKPENIWVYLS
jgi:hypothetical protein